MAEGLVVVRSALGFGDTLHGLVAALERRGVRVFAQVDHALNAQEAGLELRPTTLVVFGAAQAGTPLMQTVQTLGLDLPLRALVYEEADGGVRIAYNTPEWIVTRQGLDPAALPTTAGMSKLLDAVAREAAGT